MIALTVPRLIRIYLAIGVELMGNYNWISVEESSEKQQFSLGLLLAEINAIASSLS
jgi:hypothetical protein